MRLNAKILYEKLAGKYKTGMYGTAPQDLCLHRPEFYLNRDGPFSGAHCYLAMADQLPMYPDAEDGCVLLIFGGTPPSYYRAAEKFCVLMVETDAMLEVFNELQHLYDVFDEWESRLLAILEQNGSIQDMLDASFPILHNPMIVTDVDYHFIAYSRQIREMEALSFYRPDENGGYSAERLSKALNGDDNTREKKEPFMGRAIAKRFVQESANVIGAARRKERLDQLAEELKALPGTFVPFCGDITKPEDAAGMIAATASRPAVSARRSRPLWEDPIWRATARSVR